MPVVTERDPVVVGRRLGEAVTASGLAHAAADQRALCRWPWWRLGDLARCIAGDWPHPAHEYDLVLNWWAELLGVDRFWLRHGRKADCSDVVAILSRSAIPEPDCRRILEFLQRAPTVRTTRRREPATAGE